MDEINDEGIRVLYMIARQDEDAMVSETQKEAVRQLKDFALKGNEDAKKALANLSRNLRIHPFLRELIRA